MNVLKTILYILLFVVFLSLLIMIHELGHFTAAKIFKVYVQEYSIGFGPALIHKKRKNGETYFSLRVIPFGGYVSMYGEGVQLEEGVVVDESRSLDGIKKWKRAIILVAGVTMNAVLALHLFFISNIAFPNQMCYYSNMTIAEDSIASQAGLKTLDYLALDDMIDESKTQYTDDLHIIDMETTITYMDETTETVYTYMDLSRFTNYKELNMNRFLRFFAVAEGKVNYSKEVVVNEKFVSAKMNFKTVQIIDQETKEYQLENHVLTVGQDSTGMIENFGYELYLETTRYNFIQALGKSFKDFGNSSLLIFKAIGTLFTKETWSQLGGIIAVGFQTTSVLQNFGFGKFLYIWGALSVNLAIINLLPFPGLDGWQLLVLAIEGITKKKVPNKVKTIVSIVGLVILFAFMGVLLIKDFIMYLL